MPFLRFFLLGSTIPLLALLLLGIYLQPLSGDLARLGNYSERSWGWNRDQPAIHVRPNDPQLDAQVIVIGDSFSELNMWQSVAADRLGQSFLTFHWSDIGDPACLPAAIAALKRRYAGAQTVVIELVERSFLRRFENSGTRPAKCVGNISTSIHSKEESSQVRRSRYVNPMPDPVYAIRAFLADLANHQGAISSTQTSIVPLDREDLFSNKESGKLLFINEDLVKGEWRPEQIDHCIRSISKLSKLEQELDIAIVLAVVPDKTTTYSGFIKNQVVPRAPSDIWSALNAAGVSSVDLNGLFRMKVGGSVDFYLPDDTHLGSRGYIAMGETIAQDIARRLVR